MKVTALYRYPVKSLRGTALTHAHVERQGLQGDRRWLVVDATGKFQTIREHPIMTQIEATLRDDGGLVLSHPRHGSVAVAAPTATAARQVRVWRDDVDAVAADAAAGQFLTTVLGLPVDLVYLANPDARPVDPDFGQPGDTTSFADGFPVLLTNTMSLNDLNSRLPSTFEAGKIEMRRFRPNLVISGARPWVEDTWQAIRVGNVIFRVAKACARCVVTTRDPDTGEQADPREPLRTLASFHRAANGGVMFGQNLIPDQPGEIRVGDLVDVLQAGGSNLHLTPICRAAELGCAVRLVGATRQRLFLNLFRGRHGG